MLGFIVRKLTRLILTLVAVSAAAAALSAFVPGNAAVAILGIDNLAPEQVAAVEHAMGLDQPLPIRYVTWLGNAVRGDLGYSYVLKDHVGRQILQRLPVPLELIIMSVTVALIVAIPLGVVSAYRVGRPIDQLVSAVTFAFLAVPGFVLALALILVFAVGLRMLPAVGWSSFAEDPLRNLTSAILPATALAIPEIAIFTRLMRSEMIATLQQEFIIVAQAKGLRTSRIMIMHALKPSALPLLTLVGIRMGNLISGTVIVESIFSLPGIGTLLIQAIYSHDYITIQGIALVVATGFVTINLIVDAAYALLDPRIRTTGG